MPLRPAGLVRRTPGGSRRAIGGAFLRPKRLLLYSLLALLLPPLALALIYRFVPPPITPLMLIRLTEGEGLDKQWQPLARIAPALADAVVAAEDNRFCAHWGFDWPALEGEIDSYLAGERPRGASTITMQTAKNLFLWPERSLLRKLLEAALTPQIALLWPKRRVIEVYLNIVEFGPGIYGAEAAARSYFAKPAAELSRREAALLAAVLPHPRESSPARPSAYLEDRARTIQGRIEQLGPMLDCVRAG
jgi:monofunctional biosynthetic peptidoglycan transglycosylase